MGKQASQPKGKREVIRKNTTKLVSADGTPTRLGNRVAHKRMAEEVSKELKKDIVLREVPTKPLRVRDPAHPRTVTVTDDQIYGLLEMVATEGVSLTEACLMKGVAYRAVQSRIHRTPALSLADARAREHYVRFQARRMNEIADTEPDVQRARLKCDNIKWEAVRVLPKEYGDKLELASNPDNPVIPHDPSKLAQLTDEQLDAAITAARILSGHPK